MNVGKSSYKSGTGQYKAVVIGASAGGADALRMILTKLTKDFKLPILLVQHLHSSDEGGFSAHVGRMTCLPVIEPCDKEKIKEGHIYTAPANYHMLVEREGTISLSVDEKVNWSRPSIDVLFESAAMAFGENVIGVILSGANADGTKGMLTIKNAGGFNIAQTPENAEYPAMPQAAIDAGAVNEVLNAEDIGCKLIKLGLN